MELTADGPLQAAGRFRDGRVPGRRSRRYICASCGFETTASSKTSTRSCGLSPTPAELGGSTSRVVRRVQDLSQSSNLRTTRRPRVASPPLRGWLRRVRGRRGRPSPDRMRLGSRGCPSTGGPRGTFPGLRRSQWGDRRSRSRTRSPGGMSLPSPVAFPLSQIRWAWWPCAWGRVIRTRSPRAGRGLPNWFRVRI